MGRAGGVDCAGGTGGPGCTGSGWLTCPGCGLRILTVGLGSPSDLIDFPRALADCLARI